MLYFIIPLIFHTKRNVYTLIYSPGIIPILILFDGTQYYTQKMIDEQKKQGNK